MDYGYQDRRDLEDDLYQDDEGDSEGSEVSSELEFRLYSQLHYSANPGELEEQHDEEKEKEEKEGCWVSQQEAIKRSTDMNGKQERRRDDLRSSPPYGKLQLHLKKKKGKKQEKQNHEKKRDPAGQKPSSLCFEEVIVIDSSPDVISISENSAEEDDGICSLKAKGSHRLQASTPALQDSLKKKRAPWGPVIVDSSSSESESEESECESEPDSDSVDSSGSEALENWMILGRGNQDGDQSISLNLEESLDSNTDGFGENWLVSEKDKEAQIFNRDKGVRLAVQRTPNRYFSDKNVNCRNCNKMGHLSKNCPLPKKLVSCFLCGIPGHLSSECPNKHCYNCGLPGHVYSSCSERSYRHKQCHRCSKTGHFFDFCPEIWRQYHITTKAGPPVKSRDTNDGRSPGFCYNCSRRGHLGHVCPKKGMFNGVYPNAPFINHYDTDKEISGRHIRMKFKVKELKKNGWFPTAPYIPLTPGPPMKKQKLSHPKNNRQFSNTTRKSPNNHKSSHIFFSDHQEFSAATAKPSRHQRQENIFSSAKPWKPKRPVPTTRTPPPMRLVLDEAEDFPRGGGTGERMQEKKQKKRKIKLKNQVYVPSARPPETGAGPPTRTTRGRKHTLLKREDKKKNRWRNQAKRGNRSSDSNMYPTDENLFIIKQRKRRR